MANVKFFNENTCYNIQTFPNLHKFMLHNFRVVQVQKIKKKTVTLKKTCPIFPFRCKSKMR